MRVFNYWEVVSLYHKMVCRHVIGNHTNNLVLVASFSADSINRYQDTSDNQCTTIEVQSIETVNPLCDLVLLKTSICDRTASPIGTLDEVKVGDKLVEIDIEKIKRAGYNPITIMIATNFDQYSLLKFEKEQKVIAGKTTVGTY